MRSSLVSHEALLLPYEQAQTRRVPHNDGWYNLSTHLPWIGMRTCDPDGAHVEYAKGIANPIGIKVGTAMTAERIQRLLRILDPTDEPGRITLIHRYGCEHIEKHLPAMIEAVRQTGKTVLWCCDPMHGNTQVTRDGIKTRHFEDIVLEVSQAMDIHAGNGQPSGRHPHRVDRRRRYRMRRRSAGSDGSRSEDGLPVAGRSPIEL